MLFVGIVIIIGILVGVGVGWFLWEFFMSGDEFVVEVLLYIGILINKFENVG